MSVGPNYNPNFEWVPLRDRKFEEYVDQPEVNMDVVLDKLNPELPQIFKDQSFRAASFIAQLDENALIAIANPEISVFVNQLAHTGFVNSVYFREILFPMYKGVASPEIVLPRWLYESKVRSNKTEPFDEKELKEKFDSFSEKFSYERRTHGKYFMLGPAGSFEYSPRRFKCYIEGANLLKALNDNTMIQLINNLNDIELNPSEMKLYEGDRGVLYFGHDVARFNEIRVHFERLGIDFRGPAQDIFEVIPQEGRLFVEASEMSNDSSLGENTHNPYREIYRRKYSQAGFLEDYLKLCAFAGKAPDMPYATSFIYLLDREGEIKEDVNINLVIASQLSTYPAVYASYRKGFRIFK